MASKRLTDISSASGVTLSDLIHIVDPNDSSQDAAGSSYKATLQQVYDAFNLSGTATNFIHRYTIFVDPNGDDMTAEVGNMQKPFNTLEGALIAAAAFMETNDPFSTDPSINNFFQSVGGGFCLASVGYRYPLRIQIHVFPGFYQPTVPNDFGTTNLMYNHIDWYFHPGAIVFNYSWSDANNIINETTGIPVYCNVYGHGTFINNNQNYFDISLINEGSELNIEGESSDYRISIENGICKAKFKHLFVFCDRLFFGYYNSIEGGQLTLESEIVKTIYSTSTTVLFTGFMYQGSGQINIKFNRYTGLNTEVQAVEPPCTVLDDITKYYEGGTTYPANWWGWRLFREDVEDYAITFGYFEEDTGYGFPTETRLQIDYAKIYYYLLQFEGGYFEFYPGKIYIKSFGTPFDISIIGAYLGFFGGPYYTGANSKFMTYGGTIIFENDNVISYGGQNIYGIGITMYDTPIIYIKETQFIWGPTFTYINAIYYDGNSYYPAGYQEQGLILDGAKFAVKSNDKAFKYLFGNYSIPFIEPPLNIRVYNNVFTNLNSTLLDPTGPNSVTNIIPTSNIIVDDGVLLITSDIPTM